MPADKSKDRRTQLAGKGKDDKFSEEMGAFHTHTCGWCRGDIACYNGPTCDVVDGQMHCCQACHDHEPGREGRAEGNRVY